jgi:Tol biopolymer transport system component
MKKAIVICIAGLLILTFVAVGKKPPKPPPEPPPDTTTCTEYNPQIAYVRNISLAGNEFQNELMVMNADGSCQRPVYGEPGRYIESPTWSPDGRYLAFITIVSDVRDTDIFVVGVPQTWESAAPPPCDLEVSHPDRWRLWSSAWSPVPLGNGRHKLAYVDAGDIFLVDVDGSCTPGEAVNFTNTPDLIEWVPTWSPDGSHLASDVTIVGMEGLDLMLYEVKGNEDGSVTLGGAPINLTPPEGLGTNLTGLDDVWAPSWGKQSNQIVFEGETWDAELQRYTDWDIYAIDLGADLTLRNLRRVTHTPDLYLPIPDWSPDDGRIAFSASVRSTSTKGRRKTTLSKWAIYWVYSGGDEPVVGPYLLAEPGENESWFLYPVWRRNLEPVP